MFKIGDELVYNGTDKYLYDKYLKKYKSYKLLEIGSSIQDIDSINEITMLKIKTDKGIYWMWSNYFYTKKDELRKIKLNKIYDRIK